ncbi:MAG: MarR family transcriptional regulator [Desulfuromonadaceae bacterium]|nr:MarR family transcriptional regulator [Desulfuromonadaceae bacterium]MDD5105608.1 MarR family transcriptional regulator [Desulfuromonadaceae bacterium]
MKTQREGGFLLSRIHQLSGRILARKLKEYQIDEINPAQGRIMFALWRTDNISIQELSKSTSLGKSTLTSMLDRLEEAGHICRVPSCDDRRKIMIRLTEKNKRLRGIYDQVSSEMTELFYGGFSGEEIDQFEEYLRRILTTLEGNGVRE